MIGRILHWFYCLRIWQVFLLVLLALCVYLWLKKQYGESKYWKPAAGLLLLVAVIIVLYITLGQRWEYAEAKKPNLIPLFSYYQVLYGGNPEIFRTNFMNILMFFPLGLLTCEVYPKAWKHKTKLLLSVIIFMMLSIAIEYLQYAFALGLAETDDVIHNTLGAVLGSYIGRKLANLCSVSRAR